ncbi:MAG: sodium:proton antiporter, partial [Mesorhizobium sp.]
LQAGNEGALKPLVAMVTTASGGPNDLAYFWLTGILSSFLDNAPTYLVFFELAGGDPERLMTTLAGTLAAISTGAVFMGANTYIGNAPNFMVYAIARQRGVNMPSFFGYMAWSGVVLIPTFILSSWIFFD